jgi:hypothetical protein
LKRGGDLEEEIEENRRREREVDLLRYSDIMSLSDSPPFHFCDATAVRRYIRASLFPRLWRDTLYIRRTLYVYIYTRGYGATHFILDTYIHTSGSLFMTYTHSSLQGEKRGGVTFWWNK